MDLYYAPPEQVRGDRITLVGEESAHLVRVMRKRAGEEILVADGQGMAYTAALVSIERRSTTCRIVARHPELNESPRRLTLAVGLPKNPSRFDVLVEKATEIGVARIIPLLTHRTVRHTPRTERWQAIALAAMKQSLRSRLPRIDEPRTLGTLLEDLTPTAAAILHASDSVAALGALSADLGERPLVLVGPEGGFTDEELQQAASAGCRPASLGQRRLRTETAAIAAAALLLLDPVGSGLP